MTYCRVHVLWANLGNSGKYILVYLHTQCPPKEPAVSVYLRVCSECQRHLEDRQVAAYKASLPADSAVDVVSATWDKMQQQCDEFRALEQRVEAALPEVSLSAAFLLVRPFCSFGLIAHSVVFALLAFLLVRLYVNFLILYLS